MINGLPYIGQRDAWRTQRSPVAGVVWGYRMYIITAYWRQPGAAAGYTMGAYAMADYQRAADWRCRTQGE